MANFTYEIFKGVDTGATKSPSDHLVAQFNDSKKVALECYKEVQLECLKASKEGTNADNRCYCYMVEVNLNKKIFGEKEDGEIVDCGYFSQTIYEHSYTQRPRKHTYMVNIEDGKTVNYNKILEGHLYETVL